MQIAVIGRARGGTTVLRQFIGSTNSTYDIGEVFHSQTDLQFNFWGYLHNLSENQKRFRHPASYRDAWRLFIKDMKSNVMVPNIVYDLKVDYFSYVMRIYGSRISAFPFVDDTKIVYLRRNNIAALVISRLTAEATNIWSNTSNSAPEELSKRFAMVKGVDTPNERPARITIKPDELLSKIEYNIDQDKLIYDIIKDLISIELNYESLFDSSGNFSSEVCDKISNITGIPSSQFCCEPVLSKQRGRDILEMITNRSEIIEFFKDTPYSWMFDAA